MCHFWQMYVEFYTSFQSSYSQISLKDCSKRWEQVKLSSMRKLPKFLVIWFNDCHSWKYLCILYFIICFLENGVSPCCPGWGAGVMHRPDSTIDQHGSFDLLFVDVGQLTPPQTTFWLPTLPGHHIDTELSVDTWSVWFTTAQNSWAQVTLLPWPPE